jgi:glycosyltransferase involved in cell wall biosynthesis
MKISVVVPAYNEEKNIGACIAAIENSRARLHGHGSEVIVVDNNSTDGTARIAASFPGVMVVKETRKGIVWARKAGQEAATGDVVAHVDADNRPDADWLSKVVREFENDPDLVCLSGPLFYYDLPAHIRALIAFYYRVGYCFYLLNRFVFNVGSMVQGGNFALKRQALDRAGGFDTTIDFYGEDADIARRMHKVGHAKFLLSLTMPSSGRRVAHEGVLTMGIRYPLNYFWTLYMKRPFTKTSKDIRI